MHQALDRTKLFCERFGLRLPVLLAPMAGSCPTGLSVAVANAGGLGACGALVMQPKDIEAWAREVRAASNGAFNINLWIPDPPPKRDTMNEEKLRIFLGHWGPPVPSDAGDLMPVDFAAQCEAVLAVAPPVVSSIMGLYPKAFVARAKQQGIKWLANATTVAEARAAEDAGADAIVAQGMEAGGHRGTFDATVAESRLVGLFALLPAIVDAVRVPVIATGGIADGRGVAAALVLGASAVQIGTGFLRCPESTVHPAWADAIARTAPEDTVVTRAFSGRPGRAIATDYVRAAAASDAPSPAPYPVQRGLSRPMIASAYKTGDVQRMQPWAGQSAGLASAEPAGELVHRLWNDALTLLGAE